MNFIFNSKSRRRESGSLPRTLAELRRGESAIVDALDVDADTASHLMHLGFFPGVKVVARHSVAGGDPIVYHIEGADIALRRELSSHILLRSEKEESEPLARGIAVGSYEFVS